MAKSNPSLVRRILDVPAEIVVALYVIADAIISPLFRPIVRLLSSLQIIKRIERWIASLNPYVILVALGVPFGIAELTKALGVFLMSEGHFHTGMTLLIGAYVFSILICERVFHAGKDQLLTIGWFAVGYNWVMVIRDQIFDWFRETRIWKAAVEFRRKIRIAFRRLRPRKRPGFGMKPRGVFERP